MAEGKVVRNRRFCFVCGPGVRLAKHANRYHCGKCGKTLRIEDQWEKWYIFVVILNK